jgi:membrane-associated protein
MQYMTSLLEFLLHFDKYFLALVETVGAWSYVILFGIVFAETGLVVAPFLPGDSLLFIAGTLSGSGHLNILVSYVTLVVAAILGDTANYWIGHYLGPKVFEKSNSKIFKKEYLEKTREFYDKHGGKTIILARFLPIIRTFAPFVAGVGKMHYDTFLKYNVIGAFIWVTLFLFAGYFFGSLPFIQENFHYTALLIIIISVLPMVYEYFKYKKGPEVSSKQLKHATYKEVVKTVEKED